MQNRSRKVNYNLKLIQNIRKYIHIDTTKMLLSTLVLSQLDYVNSMLLRAPATTMKPYQKIQNFAARVTYKKSKREDAHICLQELHWLPIKYRPHSNCSQLYTIPFMEMFHDTLRKITMKTIS